MTDIDLKRLAEDREYWDECATWRGARYYCTNSGRFNTPHEWPCDSCIPRPIKQEWEKGQESGRIERQREELEELLSEYSFDIGEDYSKAADAILSRYNLEPKP